MLTWQVVRLNVRATLSDTSKSKNRERVKNTLRLPIPEPSLFKRPPRQSRFLRLQVERRYTLYINKMSSVFKGFTALLASPAGAAAASSSSAVAKFSSAAAATKSATSKVAKKTPKKTTTSKPKAEKPAGPRTTIRPTGIFKLTPVSPALGQFLGAQQASRTEAVKQIWTYIKSNNLQNPNNKREIFCDEKLKTIFDGKEKVGFLEIGKMLSRHFVKTA
ncbi:hypothetical protein DITRI_Ditri06bG0115500 [Diplodiscus trichospermus]